VAEHNETAGCYVGIFPTVSCPNATKIASGPFKTVSGQIKHLNIKRKISVPFVKMWLDRADFPLVWPKFSSKMNLPDHRDKFQFKDPDE
jgi:hypothetical protein